MFRGTARAFEADLKAQNLTMKTLDDKELWNQYKVYERYFLLLPLMHAEDPKITRRQVTEYARLVKQTKGKSPEDTTTIRMLEFGVR